MIIRKVLGTIVDDPPRAVEFCYGVIGMLLGIMVISGQHTDEIKTPTLTAGIGNPYFISFFGLSLFLIGAYEIYGIARPRPNSSAARRRAAFGFFLLFMYITVLRVIVFGFGHLVWLTLLLNALVAGIMYIKLRISHV